MKKKVFMLALLALGLTAAGSAQGQSASGQYQFSLTDGYTKYVEFDAKGQADGSATGRVYLSDEATLVYRDVDGTGDPSEKYPGFYITADVDGLLVNKNQAVVSATVRESSVRYLVGQRMLLTVEDNGDNTRVPDQVTWGLYQPINRTWTPSDSELKPDPGVGATWEATDSERRDDTPIKMPRDESITTESFPVASYDFVAVAQAAGDIRVSP